jgi:hypothetical protein
MPKKNIHVPRTPDSKWRLVREGATRSSGIFDTQEEAIQQGIDYAKIDRVELFIHRVDGKIRERNTYGHDPYPPKG